MESDCPCRTQTHPDLQLWCQPWKRAERPWRRGGSGMGTDAAPSPALTDEGSEKDHKSLARGGAEALMSAAMEKLSRASSSAFSPYQSFQDSYIMSEHCYQKPRAYYPAVEQRLVVETTRRGSELEDSLRSTEDLLEREQRYGGMLETARPKAPTHLNTHTKVSSVSAFRHSPSTSLPVCLYCTIYPSCIHYRVVDTLKSQLHD